MSIEKTILDFQISNNYEQCESQLDPEEQPSIFKEKGIKTFYIGKSLNDPRRPTVFFQAPDNVPKDIFMDPETKLFLKLQIIFMQ